MPVSHLDDHEETHTPCPGHRLSRRRKETDTQTPSSLGDTSGTLRTQMTCTPSPRPQLESRGASAVSGHRRQKRAHGQRAGTVTSNTKGSSDEPQRSDPVFREPFGYRYRPHRVRHEGELNVHVTLIPLHRLPSPPPFHGLVYIV